VLLPEYELPWFEVMLQDGPVIVPSAHCAKVVVAELD
jgi:hypothetical protein